MGRLYSQPRLTRLLIISESFDSHDAFGYGIFQKNTALLFLISAVVLNSQTTVIPLIAGDVDHWCQQPPDSNVSALTWRKEFIPVEADGLPSRCHAYSHRTDFNDTELIACQEWEYDSNTTWTTVVSLWNLVCHRRWLLVAAQAAHNGGSVIFTILAGPMADYFGRAPVIRATAGLTVISTVGSCFVTSYTTYIIVRFVTSGFVTVNCMLSCVLLFEITTHEHRPLHIIFAGTMAVGLTDLWFFIMTHIQLDWATKQAVYLAPTVLSLLAFIIVQESPRWLISQGNLDAAENVILEGARVNGYPLPNTAYLLYRLREQARDCNQDSLSDPKPIDDDCPLLRRQLIMTVSYFSLIFALNVSVFSQLPRKQLWFQWASFSVLLLAYTVMHFCILRVPLLKVIRLCYLSLGVIHSLLSIAVYIQPTIITEFLLILSRACVYVATVTSIAYVMELVPTGIRASALLGMFGCGRMGAVCASVIFVLQRAGREDAAFFIAGFLLFASLPALEFLPRTTVVECAKMYTRRESTCSRQAVEQMKMTLQTYKSPKSSRSSGRSSSHPSRRTSVLPSAIDVNRDLD